MAETTIPTQAKENGDVAATREESRYLLPPVDIYEGENDLFVTADLPGIDKESADVRVDKGILTIKATPSYVTRGQAVVQEFGLMSFYRQFQLSDEVDQEKIEASYKNGVLTVRLPKAEKAKPREIKVSIS